MVAIYHHFMLALFLSIAFVLGAITGASLISNIHRNSTAYPRAFHGQR